MDMIKTDPAGLPNPENRKRRELPKLDVAPPPKQPEIPSKAELKAQKKTDRRNLNMLKIMIQHIMEQIKKYKKFRHPVIDESRIGYLFDEQTPEIFSTDLPEEQRGQDQYRPFEIREDSKGVRGLLEVDTGKFYYNLETVTIEKRLSNGYYKRPKDFFADIKRLAKDAKTIGDEDRTIKANELLCNVEVDIQLLEENNQALVAACDQVYEREEARAKLAREKAHIPEQSVPRLPDVPPRISDKTTTQSTGPITLGEPLAGKDPIPFATSARPVEGSQLTNGDINPSDAAHRPNGQSDVDRDGDVAMEQGEEEGHASAANTQQRSQRSALTAMAPASQLNDYHNSASTTTSDQKTSEKSNNRSSGPYNNSQSTNGILRDEHPDFSAIKDMSGQSDLPDTQDMYGHRSSQSQAASQPQPMGPPPVSRQATSIANILNTTNNASPPKPAEPQPQMILEVAMADDLHDNLTKKSSGCSVEQLEQINSVLMDKVWRMRSEWNRNQVVRGVQDAFNLAIEDIDHVQKISPNSQGSGSCANGVGAADTRRRGSSDAGGLESSPFGNYATF